MTFTIDIDGLDTIEREYQEELSVFVRKDLTRAVDESTNAGMRAVYEVHPYTDRTSNLTGHMESDPARVSGDDVVGYMKNTMFYAGYVNAMQKFAFMPRAEKIADNTLETEVQRAVDNFVARMNSKGSR